MLEGPSMHSKLMTPKESTQALTLMQNSIQTRTPNTMKHKPNNQHQEIVAFRMMMVQLDQSASIYFYEIDMQC